MRSFLLLIFAFASLSSFAVPRGWICRVAFSCFECKRTGTTSQGKPIYTASYNGDIYFWVCYWPNTLYPDAVTTSPSLTDLGLTRYCDLNGNSARQDRTGPFKQWLVQNMTYNPIYDNVDMSPFGDLSDYHGLGPMYQSDLGLPFTVDNSGNYNGPNNNFDYGSVNPLQGEQDPNSYIYYDKKMKPQEGSSPPSDGYRFVYSESDGWKLVPYSSDGSSNVDLSPVISSIEGVQSRQDLLREQLIAQLGAAGNSWVYDCKLSLEDLRSLAGVANVHLDTLQGQGVEILNYIDHANSHLDDISVSAVSIDNKLFTANDNLSSIASSVGGLGDAVYSVRDSVESGNNQIVSRIGDLIQTVQNEQADDGDIPSLPSPDFGDKTADQELPFSYDNWSQHATMANTRLVAWGNNPNMLLTKYDVVSSLLTKMVGSIPSVGSDPVMFSIDWNIPFVGQINKTFSFADFPAISYFRTACLYFLYVFFALAIGKLILHAFI